MKIFILSTLKIGNRKSNEKRRKNQHQWTQEERKKLCRRKKTCLLCWIKHVSFNFEDFSTWKIEIELTHQ